jgi:hypothetical protein
MPKSELCELKHNNASMYRCSQFKHVQTKDYIIKSSLGDNCVRAHDKVFVVKNIFETDQQVKLMCKNFLL